MNNNEQKLTVDELLNDGIQPNSIVPHSDNLDGALAAVAKLNVVEMTYLVGRIQTDLETYRARLTTELIESKQKNQ